MLNPEIIQGVSVRFIEGGVVTLPSPNRHHNLHNSGVTTGKGKSDQEEGFYTNMRPHINRLEAMFVAKRSGQFKRKLTDASYNGPELFSEDLW